MHQKSYQLIIFDLDGTLTDSKQGITKGIQYALSKFNIEVQDLDTLQPFIGPPFAESFQKYFHFNEEQAKQAVVHFREYYTKQGMFENKVYPGIQQLLNQLKKNNKILAVATLKPTSYAEQILQHFNLKQYFTAIIGSEFNNNRFSKTIIIEHLLSKMKDIPKKNIVMIGDREQDIVGAKNNIIDIIAVRYGYAALQELEQAEPTIIIDSVEELGKFLQ